VPELTEAMSQPNVGIDTQGLAQIDSHASGLFKVARQILH